MLYFLYRSIHSQNNNTLMTNVTTTKLWNNIKSDIFMNNIDNTKVQSLQNKLRNLKHDDSLIHAATGDIVASISDLFLNAVQHSSGFNQVYVFLFLKIMQIMIGRNINWVSM